MDQKPSLSIVIPNHKERNLMSVYAQVTSMFPDADVILSDDIVGRGKGWAMRRGVRQSAGDLICFLDGDMDIHPKEIFKLLDEIKTCDIVIGNRVYDAPLSRKVLNVGYKVLIRLLFGWSMSIDTQSGIKLFRRGCIPQWFTDSFAFDVEILVKCRDAGFKIREIPVASRIRATKSVGAIWSTLVETIKVRLSI